jgi:nitrate/nitrite transport system substrate-binding protein
MASFPATTPMVAGAAPFSFSGGTNDMTDKSCTRNDNLAWVAGSDAPEKRTLNLGFMALSDAASLIVAATQGFAQPYGLTLELKRQTSWATLRDKLLCGELDAAHSLYGQVYGIHLGLGGAPTEMAILMGLCQNGQAINLSEPLRQAGVTRAEALAARVRQQGAKLTFAQTFPTGTHAMWLYYWLAAQGIHPLEDVNSVVVPPSQMVQHLRAGRIDGFCAGGPWGALAVDEKQGFTLATSQMIWPDHPEKVLGCTRAFVEQYPNTARALTMAVLEASRFIDGNDENKRSTAQLISGSDYLDAPLPAIQPRFLGCYEDGLGHAWRDAHPLRFFADGAATMPWLSDGIWFMTQFRRWGLLRDDPDYLDVARRVHQLDLYREAAEALGIAVPEHPMRRSRLLDGSTWDGSDPAGYARGFAIHGRSSDATALSL